MVRHEPRQKAISLTAQIHEDIACTACGCVCDDLRLTVDGGRIVKAERACALAEPWLLGQDSAQPATAAVNGSAVSLAAALQQAADILSAARNPLIWGLSRSSTPGQRAAVSLAETIGATIDTTASLCHGPSIMAIQEVGESTSSLGEIRHRADLVIYWGVDPLTSHPRHLERYSMEPTGEFVARGRADRTLIVVDHELTETAKIADEFVPIEPDGDFEALWTLRCLMRGIEPSPQAPTGAPLATLRALAQRMTSCRSGVLFFGLGLSRQGLGHRHVEALLRLVTDLNAHTRFYARRMRIPGDVAGADSVLCWQTGFPFSVSLSRGYPRYNPGEYSANEVLERREADACLLVGSEGVAQLSPAARAHLNSVPTIVLDHPTVTSLVAPTVRFTTAVYGIHLPGTVYRMDEVPIPLRAVLPPKFPSDEQVLRDIEQMVQRRASK